MSFLFDILYAIGFVAAVPLLAYKSWRTGKYRSGWGERFGRYEKKRPLAPQEVTEKSDRRKRVLIHAVSVGELLSVRGLVDRLLQDPAMCVAITTTTDTGTRRAREIYGAAAYQGRVETYRFPLDFSFAVKSLLRQARPDVIALVELETWPNFIRIASGRGIPVVVINGRMTERAAGRYRIVGPIVRGMLRRLAWLGVQTETIARRFERLGARRERITVLPTLKYDTADLGGEIKGTRELAEACGILPVHQVFVGGSTGPGEEAFLIATYLALREKHPSLRLAIAPRKPETVAGVEAAIRAAGLKVVLRTQRPDGVVGLPLGPDDVLVLNTLGELKKLYALGVGSFVGRSLVKLGGSDMIEVAAMGKACCFGPHTFNFAEAVELLTQHNAAVEVKSAEELTAALAGCLADPPAAEAMGQRAREVISRQRGSTEKYAGKLREMLEEVHKSRK